MSSDSITVLISMVGAWILIIITKLLSGDFIERTKLFERGNFDIKLETVLVGVYMFIVFLVLRRLSRKPANRMSEGRAVSVEFEHALETRDRSGDGSGLGR